MSNLTWIACNGVKPNLTEDAKVHIIFREQGKLVENGPYGATGWLWDSVICYALGQCDPVQELVDAAKGVLGMLLTNDEIDRSKKRLRRAIKSVEEVE